jgi:hypothetical protein
MRQADDDSDFQEEAAAYESCMKAYADRQSQLAKLHNDAANAAIEQFNAFARKANEMRENGD